MTGFAVKSKGMPRMSAYSTLNRSFFVEVIRLAAQCAADDLFAQELGAERAHAKYMRHRVGVPAFGEHRDGHDAADGFAQAAELADGVHNFAQQFLIGDIVGRALVAGALDDLAPKAVNLVGGHVRKLSSSASPDSSCSLSIRSVRARERVAVLVEVAEECQAVRSPT